MNIAIVADEGNADGTLGGAELTTREFALAAPDDVTLVDLQQADTVIVANCVTFGPKLIPLLEGKRVVRYHNDLARFESRELREWLETNATHVFTSPLHQRLYGLDGDWPNVPPPIDLDAFYPPRKRVRRTGACAIAPWQNPGKGQVLLREWAEANEPVDVYGGGPFTPQAECLPLKGALAPENVPTTLWRYQRFVHLPTSPEPFGRAVVESWAAGCDLVVNRLVGALHYIEHEPDKLRSAAADFWALVTEKVTA